MLPISGSVAIPLLTKSRPYALPAVVDTWFTIAHQQEQAMMVSFVYATATCGDYNVLSLFGGHAGDRLLLRWCGILPPLPTVYHTEKLVLHFVGYDLPSQVDPPQFKMLYSSHKV